MNEYVRGARGTHRELDRLDRERERALDSSRRLVRLSAGLIRGLHGAGWDAKAAREAEREAQALRRGLARHPEFGLHGAIVQALGEYVEAHLFRRLVEGRRPASVRSLRVPAPSWLHGLADVVGEARRLVLDRLLRDDHTGALAAFEQMGKVYEALHAWDYPEGIVPIKAKRDAARALLEKTRGDLLTAKRAKELEKKIDGIQSLLDEAEGGPRKRPRAKGDDDLDIDSAWSRS